MKDTPSATEPSAATTYSELSLAAQDSVTFCKKLIKNSAQPHNECNVENLGVVFLVPGLQFLFIMLQLLEELTRVLALSQKRFQEARDGFPAS